MDAIGPHILLENLPAHLFSMGEELFALTPEGLKRAVEVFIHNCPDGPRMDIYLTEDAPEGASIKLWFKDDQSLGVEISTFGLVGRTISSSEHPQKLSG